jgi:hypothetical protein
VSRTVADKRQTMPTSLYGQQTRTTAKLENTVKDCELLPNFA